MVVIRCWCSVCWIFSGNVGSISIQQAWRWVIVVKSACTIFFVIRLPWFQDMDDGFFFSHIRYQDGCFGCVNWLLNLFVVLLDPVIVELDVDILLCQIIYSAPYESIFLTSMESILILWFTFLGAECLFWHNASLS